MTRVILLAHPPGLVPGRWDITKIDAAAACDLIVNASRGKRLLNRVTFDSTLDVIYAVCGLSLKRFDSTDVGRKPVDLQPGDVVLSVLLNARGKLKRTGSALDSTDLDWYRIEIT